MKIPSRIMFCCACFLALSALAQVRSKWIRIENGGAVADDKGGFHLMQLIRNTSEQPLWVTVRQGEGTDCVVSSKIEPNKTAMFSCDVADLQAGKVPVVIAIFADEAHTQVLETLRDAMQFSKDDARALRNFNGAQKLPVTYEGVTYSEKFGLGAIFRTYSLHSNGKLVISSSDITYVNGNQTVTIPLLAVRDMGFTATTRDNPFPWIIIVYEDAGHMKRAYFRAIDRPPDVNAIVDSLKVAFRDLRDGTEDVPGETQGSPALRRDTVHTILESEKVLAPGCASPKVVDTKIVGQVAGEWAENWIVDRCGTSVTYGVSYRTDARGGTFIAVKHP